MPAAQARTTEDASLHPLDDWLRRELRDAYPTNDSEPLPPDMTELARKLEQALESARCRKK